jgi:hypothetical protein
MCVCVCDVLVLKHILVGRGDFHLIQKIHVGVGGGVCVHVCVCV